MPTTTPNIYLHRTGNIPSNQEGIIFHVSKRDITDKAHHLKVKWELERAGIAFKEVGLWEGNVYHMAFMVPPELDMIVKTYLWERNIPYYYSIHVDSGMTSIKQVCNDDDPQVELEYEVLEFTHDLFLVPDDDDSESLYNLNIEFYEKDGSSRIYKTMPARTKAREDIITTYFGFSTGTDYLN
jgi:hypothetical protein